MVGAKGRHPVRRAVVDGDPDGDTPLERNRDAHSNAHCDGDANCDGIYTDNCDTDFDAGRTR